MLFKLCAVAINLFKLSVVRRALRCNFWSCFIISSSAVVRSTMSSVEANTPVTDRDDDDTTCVLEHRSVRKHICAVHLEAI